MSVHIIPDEVETVITNEKSEKLSDFTYHKKYINTDTYSCGRVLNVLNKIDTSYNPTM